MAKPVICIGNIPHENFSIYGAEQRFFKAPYIMIGIEECTYDYSDATIPILIQVCCYTAEAYNHEENDLRIPDNMGILDVLNLIENIREWIINDSRIPTERPVRIGEYGKKELTYPLAFGYMTFELGTCEGQTNRKKIDYD